MSEITYMTGAGLSDAISATSQAVSGMTIAEASAALGGKVYETNGLTEILSFPINESKGGQSMTVQAQYAAQLWDYWKTAGAAAGTTALGAAASAAKTWASGVLFGDAATAGTLAGTGGLLTMSIPALAAAAAPILGVSLGKVLYDSNPDLWTKISQTLLPWAYKDTQTAAAVVGGDGQVYIPKGAIDALKSLFEEEGIGGEPTASSDLDCGIAQPIKLGGSYTDGNLFYHLISKVCVYWDASRNVIGHLTASDQPFTDMIVGAVTNLNTGASSALTASSSHTYTLYGKTVYYGVHEWLGMAGTTGVEYLNQGVPTSNVTAWTMLYGSLTGLYPEGTSEWTGRIIDFDNTPVKPVITNPQTGATAPYFPVTLPIGDPIASPDPLVQPNPIAPVELPQLDPYVAPEPAPEMWPEFPPEIPSPIPTEKVAPQYEDDPVYVPTPDFDPDLDPSAVPEGALDPAQEPARPIPPPKPSGVTPGIVWPPVNFPTIVPTTGSGLVHVYNPTSAQLISFGSWLWVTYADPDIDKLWNNPFDGIIGAHELYATPSKDGTDTIKSGFLDSGISSTIVQQRYVSINCGSMVIPEYYGNYLDYSPYSKAFIYLPFIGIVEVDVDDIVGHSVNILYHIDSYNGSCIAQITVAKDNYVNTIYQFSGNCAVDIPLAGGSQAAIRAGMISAAAYGIGSTINGVINGAALGSIGGLAGAALGGATGAIGAIGAGVANVVSQKSTVQHSGSFGSSYGAMGIKRPYIIIRRPIQKFVNEYNLDYGYPAYIRVTIGACTGYLRVREVNVQSTLATDDEKTMIENLLKSGVYID